MSKEIVSNINDSVLPLKLSASEAKEAGNFVYSKPTPENSIILFIDQQIGLLTSTRVPEPTELKSSILGLAEKTFRF